MSTRRHNVQQQQQHQQQQQQHIRSPTKPTWEDDAWKIDSDDEDFVKASRVQGSGPSSVAVAKLLDNSTQTNNANGRPNKSESSNRIQIKSPQRHAPPARPHPYSTLSSEHINSANGIKQEGRGNSHEIQDDSNKRISSSSTATHQTGGQWMMVERSGSTGSAQAVAPLQNTGNAIISGSAIDDEEAIPPEQSPKSKREALHKDMLAAIQDDLEDVLQDPTEMLSRLSIRPNPANGSRSSSQKRIPKVGSDVPANGSTESNNNTQTTFDAANAVVAVDGIVTNLPASSDKFDARSLDVPAGSEVVVLSDVNLERRQSIRSERRKAGFIKCLNEDVVRMDELRTLAWAGVPDDLRPIIWMLLLGYLPPNKAMRKQALARKRAEYVSGVRNAFQRGTQELDQAIWHQIHIDVPRTNPGIRLWQREVTQRALERILYVWAIRHPASGYVQGINDLATPFFEVFLGAYISTDPEEYDIALLPPAALEALEADTFWCLSKLLDGIQDNYIFAQPGIQRQVRRMGELVSRINPALHGHLEDQNVEYMQFAFRWMNCLLMREMSVRNIVRMWDSYLAEGPDAFSEFHLFVCAAFLDRWSDDLRQMDFQGIIMFLQSLPTQNWSAKETELLLADAFV